MELIDGDYCLGLIAVGGFNRDWLITAARRGDRWTIEYRFRYYVDSNAFGSEDVKHFYAITVPDGMSDEAVWKIMEDAAANLVGDGFGRRIEKIQVNSTRPSDLLQALKASSFAHIYMGAPGSSAGKPDGVFFTGE